MPVTSPSAPSPVRPSPAARTLVVVLAVLGLAACDPALGATSTGSDPTGAAGSALAAARDLTVKGRAPMTGYDRELFSYGSVDVDENGCDARNDVLARDLDDVTYKSGTRDCVVASGTLQDPYSGEEIAFTRGQDTSSAVQIDHVVALADAWQKGAQQWDEATREAFGNDPMNLVAVDGPLNNAKGSGDTATWLPPNRAARCGYVARQVAVKQTYGVWVTAAEQDAMVEVLSTCPDEPLPTSDASWWPEGADADAAPAEDDVHYATCADARAAGAAPLHEGEPGYRAEMDGDGDGTACE